MSLELHLENQKRKRELKKTFSVNVDETEKMIKFNIFDLEGNYRTTVYVWKSDFDSVFYREKNNFPAYQMVEGKVEK